jgi:uncharacterized protein (UPF0548 family)
LKIKKLYFTFVSNLKDMVAITLPSTPAINDFIEHQARLSVTYPPIKGTQSAENIASFDNDFLKEKIGSGEKDFAAAKEAIRQWYMFPRSWTVILPTNAPIQTGTTIAMYARFMGIWWRNACKIVYIVDENRRFGFAYGTLPAHIECGEELFLVEMDKNNDIYYTVKAFSKPRHILAKIAYPIMRRLQDRFRRDSAVQMQDFIQKHNQNYSHEHFK